MEASLQAREANQQTTGTGAAAMTHVHMAGGSGGAPLPHRKDSRSRGERRKRKPPVRILRRHSCGFVALELRALTTAAVTCLRYIACKFSKCSLLHNRQR